MELMKAELHRTYEEARYYWLQTLSNVISTCIFFIGFYYSVPITNRGSDLFFLLSILLWYYALELTNQMSHFVLEEKYFGTIEKLFLSPYGPIAVLSARALSSLLLSTLIVFSLFVTLSGLFGIPVFTIGVTQVIVFSLTLVALYGFGLVLAGLTVLNSRTSSVSGIMIYVMLFASGMLFSVTSLPPALFFTTSLLPLTIGVENLRYVIDTNIDLIMLVGNPSFYLQVIYSFAALLCGILVFRRAVKVAKNKGIIRVI